MTAFDFNNHTKVHTRLRDKILEYLNSLPESDFEISPSGSRAGKHDITGCLSGRYVSIEVKTGKAKPTRLQLYEARQKKAAGAIVIFAYSIDEVTTGLAKEKC